MVHWKDLMLKALKVQWAQCVKRKEEILSGENFLKYFLEIKHHLCGIQFEHQEYNQ